MKSLILLSLFVLAANAFTYYDVVVEEWGSFKMQHSKKYESVIEEKFRMKIFMDNKRKIAKHNKLFAMGAVSFEQKLNIYGDMLHHEFVTIHNGFNKTVPKLAKLGDAKKEVGATFISPAHVDIPTNVDWRIHGAVTPVKDQGKCGSCWSFSATGSLEGQHFRKTGKLVSLSEQNLVDCSSSYGNNGCNGGLMDNAFRYVKDNGGIDTENTYTYEAMDDKCRYNASNSGATDAGFSDIPQGSERHLTEALATVGPISVAIDASQESFQFYHDGVYFEPMCSSDNLDHGVLAVGYGTDESGLDYYIVKNSWGVTWGQKGYINMARNKDNHCGIASSSSYPLV